MMPVHNEKQNDPTFSYGEFLRVIRTFWVMHIYKVRHFISKSLQKCMFYLYEQNVVKCKKWTNTYSQEHKVGLSKCIAYALLYMSNRFTSTTPNLKILCETPMIRDNERVLGKYFHVKPKKTNILRRNLVGAVTVVVLSWKHVKWFPTFRYLGRS